MRTKNKWILTTLFVLGGSGLLYAGNTRNIYTDAIKSSTTPGGTVTLNTTGTITVPGATDTLVGKATTDTFTNKTFNADGTGNSITNIENADIKAAAAIALNKLAATTASRALVSDGSGFVSPATTTSTQIGYLSAATGTTGTTSTNLVYSASPTFTGTVVIPTPFTLGATSMTSTGTQLNYLSSATGTTGTTSSNVVFSASPTLSGTVGGNLTYSGTATHNALLTFKTATAGLNRLAADNTNLTSSVSAGGNTTVTIGAVNGAGIFVIVDATTGATCLVYYYFNNGLNRIAQSGAEFVLSTSPGATETGMAYTSSTGVLTIYNGFGTARQYQVNAIGS